MAIAHLWLRPIPRNFSLGTMLIATTLIGVLLGLGISLLIHLFVPSLPSAVPLWSILVAVTVSMSVGLFFGMYPAVKAAKLDPVEALRYE